MNDGAPSERRPLFQRIYVDFRRQIIDGRLPLGSRLPPSRALAVELGVSRSTVTAAYEQLVAEGYIEGRQGSGYRVCETGSELRGARPETDADRNPAAAEETTAPVPFRPGVPDLRAFPKTLWARAVARVARTAPTQLFEPGPLFGDLRLREAIAAHIEGWRGVRASAEQVIVTAGAGDAVEICIRTLLTAGDTVGFEDPGYQPSRAFAESLGVKTLALPVDRGGAALPGGGCRVPMVVLTPSHQFPLGGAMAPDRRAAYLQWAAHTGGYIVEDDYDSEFRFAGRPIPALQGFDGAECTLYAGSFSKVFSVGLRLGYLVVPERLTHRFADTLTRFGTKASVTPQRPLAEFISGGEFVRHIRRMRRLYSERRRFLLAELQETLGDLIRIEDHQAGMSLVVRLPDHVDDGLLADEARARGIAVQPLSGYFADRAMADAGLLLGYSAHTPDEMAAQLPRLIPLIRRAASLDLRRGAGGNEKGPVIAPGLRFAD